MFTPLRSGKEKDTPAGDKEEEDDPVGQTDGLAVHDLCQNNM